MAQGGCDAVIVYHAIGSVPRSAPQWNGFVRPERFAAQMAFLAEHRRVVALDAVFDGDAAPGPRRVAITFDDGYRNVLEHAVPVLRELGFPATFFVPTRWIGDRNGWEAQGRAPLDLMMPDELAGLVEAGFSVQSHGHAHIDYARAPAGVVEADVRASVERLTEWLGETPRYLAYPYGHAVPAAAAESARLGLRGAFGLDAPQDIAGDFAVPRVSVVPSDARPLFALKTSGRYIGWRHSAPVRALYGATRPVLRNRWLWP